VPGRRRDACRMPGVAVKDRMRLATRTLLLLIALAAGACSALPGSPPDDALEGSAWVVATLPGRAAWSGAPATLAFRDGRASGTDGCNRYGTAYTVRGAALTLDPDAVATQMACEPAVMEQAAAFMGALRATRRYAVVDGQLELRAADGTLLARLAPEPRSLAGTRWRVTGINNGRQAVVSVAADAAVTLAFAADGQAAGSTGCNRFTAPWMGEGEALRFGPAATTRRACAEPAGVMEQEGAFLAALARVASGRREADRLELRGAGGELELQLVVE